MTEVAGIDPSVPPSGTGCLECDASGGWWLHLRRCAQCGHIGCCDTSPSQHASAHAAATAAPMDTPPTAIGPPREALSSSWR